MSEWGVRVNERTLLHATNHRDESNEYLADTLGRSLFAIQSIKTILDERLKRSVARRKTEARRNQGFDYVNTFPPGWFD